MFSFVILNLYESTTYADNSEIIPKWIKTDSELWGNNKLSDVKFVSSFEYLVENKIIKSYQGISEMKTKSSIPNWLQEPISWWKENKISNQEFIKNIDYLLVKKIIRIPTTTKQTCNEVLISLDKTSYTIDEAFYLTIKSPQANKNPQKQDMINVLVSSTLNDLPSMGVPYW